MRDELYDHLMCRYETNLAVGMDEEKATEEAINALGNKSNLKETLQKVHWYYPAEALKKAINWLLISMLFSTLAPLAMVAFGGIEYLAVISILSNVLLLVSCFAFYKVNKEFKKSFIFAVANSSVRLLYFVFMADIMQSDIAKICFSLAVSVLYLLHFAYLYSGMKKLVEPYANKKHLKLAFRIYLLTQVLISLGSLSYLWDLDIKFFFLFYVCVPLFSFIDSMLKVSKAMYNSDHEYKLEVSAKKSVALASVVIFVSLVSICGVDIYKSTRQMETTHYSVNDYEMSDEDYQSISENLVSYGIPEAYVNLLPKSEIIKYKGCVNKSELTESAQKLLENYIQKDTSVFSVKFTDAIFDHNYVTVDNFSVALNNSEVRFIKVIRIPEKADKWYKDSIVFDDEYQMNYGIYPCPTDEPYNGDLLLTLKIDDGFVYQGESRIFARSERSHIRGFEFNAEPGTVIIYATTQSIKDINSTECNLNYTYYHQKYPIAFPVRIIEFAIASENDEVVGYEKQGYGYSTHYWVRPDFVYNVVDDADKS